MAETKIVTIDGVDLVAPVGWEPMYDRLDDFPDCCGAGDGLQERLVPEKILGLRVSAACSIHDFDFGSAPATWAAFHATSFRFARNLYAIVRGRSAWGLGLLRTMVVGVYVYAVDTKGAEVFQRLKARQGQTVS